MARQHWFVHVAIYTVFMKFVFGTYEGHKKSLDNVAAKNIHFLKNQIYIYMYCELKSSISRGFIYQYNSNAYIHLVTWLNQVTYCYGLASVVRQPLLTKYRTNFCQIRYVHVACTGILDINQGGGFRLMDNYN